MNKLTLLLVLMLSSCALNPLDAVKPKPQINAQVGKENQQEVSTIKVESGNSSQRAESISNDTSYKAEVVNQISKMSLTELIILVILAGAALPSFKEMYQGFKVVVGDVLNCFVVIPCKGIKNFLIEFFGKASSTSQEHNPK